METVLQLQPAKAHLGALSQKLKSLFTTPRDPLPPSQKVRLGPPGAYINSLQSPDKVLGSLGNS